MVPLARPSRQILLIVTILALGVLVPTAIAQAIVPETPRRDVPIVLDGEVWDVEQVGSTIVVAGNFTQVQTTRDGPIVNQAAIFAYDTDSGLFLEDFRPALTANDKPAEVRDLVASPDGQSVYIGGVFTAIDDQSDGNVRVRNRLALLDVADGRLDRNFANAGVLAQVNSLVLDDGLLYAGGNFVSVLDTAPGRSPINQPVRGLARFDATTGEYDSSFRFETQNDIGRLQDDIRTFGVIRLAMNPVGDRLVVAHRGANLVNANTGQSARAGGVAIISITGSDNTGAVTGFEALYPDPDDPIQTFFHAEQCAGRGTQIRDLEISPDGSYFALTSQGSDGGFQCDSITRFEMGTSPARPTWVSRAFDSVFSIGIADDAIYIGGHFRYLVSPDAPSPYPGDNGANGEPSPRGEWYYADAEDDRESAVAFQEDLLEPGYVFPVRQLGALDPNTGYGNPAWEPGSDAAKGVLALTVTDRGLLLGQDGSRIDDQLVGRAAFFDENPDAGNPDCQVQLDNNDRPVILWTDIGNVNEWSVAANGSFIASTTGTSLVDDVTAGGETVNYELRFNRNGLSQTRECGSIVIPVLTMSCSVRTVGDQVEVSWSDEDWHRVAVRRDNSFLASVTDGSTIYLDDPGPGTWSYQARGIASVNVEAECGSVTIDAPAPPVIPDIDCTATVNGDIVQLSWNDEDWSRVSIRRDGGWISTVTGVTTFTDDPGPGTYTYNLRGVIDGERSETSCNSVTVDAPAPPVIPDIDCTATVAGDIVQLSWNDEDWSRVSIRRDGGWISSVTGVTTFTDDPGPGTYTYNLRGVIDGEQAETNCNSVTVESAQLTCTINQFGGDVNLSWNDVGAQSYQVRLNNSWVTTLGEGTTSFSETDRGGDYAIRFRVDGIQQTVDCT